MDGRKFNFRSETVNLEPDKLDKLAQQIQDLLAQKQVQQESLAIMFGHLGHTQKPPSALENSFSVFRPAQPQAIYIASIRACGEVSLQPWRQSESPPGLHIPDSSKVIKVGSARVRRKSDVPLILPNFERLTRVRVADPTAGDIALTKNSEESLAWLWPLAAPLLLHCLSAADADAMAESHKVGIEGLLCAEDGLH